MSMPDDDDVKPSPTPLLAGTLNLVSDGAARDPELTAKLAACGIVLLDRYLVMVSVEFPNGDQTLRALTPYRYVAATALRDLDELTIDFPGCAMLMATSIIDPDIPERRDEWDDAQQRLRAEMRRLQ